MYTFAEFLGFGGFLGVVASGLALIMEIILSLFNVFSPSLSKEIISTTLLIGFALFVISAIGSAILKQYNEMLTYEDDYEEE